MSYGDRPPASSKTQMLEISVKPLNDSGLSILKDGDQDKREGKKVVMCIAQRIAVIVGKQKLILMLIILLIRSVILIKANRHVDSGRD